MTEQRVSYRYARALLSTATEENISEALFEDFKTIEKYIKVSDQLEILTRSKVVQHWKKKKIYKVIFEGKISELALDLLMLLTDKGRDSLIHDIIVQYEKLYNIQNNRLPLTISSAVELTDSIKQEMNKKLSEWTQKTVLPSYVVDDKLKGGFSIKIDDMVYDTTLKHQLERLYKRLTFVQ